LSVFSIIFGTYPRLSLPKISNKVPRAVFGTLGNQSEGQSLSHATPVEKVVKICLPQKPLGKLKYFHSLLTNPLPPPFLKNFQGSFEGRTNL